MGRKKILEKRLSRLKAKKDKLKSRALASQDAAEVRSINEELLILQSIRKSFFFFSLISP